MKAKMREIREFQKKKRKKKRKSNRTDKFHKTIEICLNRGFTNLSIVVLKETEWGGVRLIEQQSRIKDSPETCGIHTRGYSRIYEGKENEGSVKTKELRDQRFMASHRALRRNIFLISRECDLLDGLREVISRATNCEASTRAHRTQ